MAAQKKIAEEFREVLAIFNITLHEYFIILNGEFIPCIEKN
jgi:hypothetical protein